MIDVNSLTLGEVAKVEDLSGQPIAAFADEDKPKGLALAALAFVWRKRQDPTFKWNDALGLTLAEANEILGIGEDDTVPTSVAASADQVPAETYAAEATESDPKGDD